MSKPVRSHPVIRLSAEWPEVELLHCDEAFLAVNKPAGLLIAPDRWKKNRENLMHLLFSAVTQQRPWAMNLGLNYLANARRLDAGTSGIAIIARTKPALVRLAQAFHDRKISELYMALVRGVPDEKEMTIDLPIGPHPNHPGISVITQANGKPAQTRIRLVERLGRYSLIHVEPLTGRLHQIRVHLQAIGCPLVADSHYGSGGTLLLSQLKKGYKFKADRPERPLMGRPALHAMEITLPHPQTGVEMTLRAEMPKDFVVSLKYLHQFT